MNPTVAAFLLFLGLAGSLGMGVMAFAGPPSNKKTLKRLDAIRERHSTSREVFAKAQMKRIVQARSQRFDAFKGLVPRRAELASRLERTGRAWTVGGYGAACAGVSVGAAMAALMAHAPILMSLMIGMFAGVGLPHMIVGRMSAKRAKAFNNRLPDAIDLLVRGLRSGLPVTESLGVVGREVPDPVGSEFRLIADKIRIGQPMDSALANAANRIRTPEFQFFVIALAIQRETGGNLTETLGNLSEVLRKRGQLKLKINAMSSEAKASAYIIGALPFCVFGLMMVINPAYVGKFFVDTRLMIAAGGGICWMSIGVAIMAKMISFKF